MVSLRFPAAAPSVVTAGLFTVSSSYFHKQPGRRVRAGQREGNGWRENLKNAGEIGGLMCELQISQTLSRAFKTFPTKWLLCITVAASSRAADLENGPAVCRVFVDCG